MSVSNILSAERGTTSAVPQGSVSDYTGVQLKMLSTVSQKHSKIKLASNIKYIYIYILIRKVKAVKAKKEKQKTVEYEEKNLKNN